jgi:hypothetical protein
VKRKRQQDVDTPELRADAEDMLAFLDAYAAQQIAEVERMQEAIQTPADAPGTSTNDCLIVSDTNGSPPGAVLDALVPAEIEKLLEDIGREW